MLSQKHRFHGHGSLKYLYRNADTYRSRHITVRIKSNPHRKDSRFAVVVSKKVHKSAVGRNRIRRRVYELLRTEMPSIGGIQDVAVIVTSGEAIFLPQPELEATLRGLLTQAGVYKSPQ
jgi:ribonuclease P protein component